MVVTHLSAFDFSALLLAAFQILGMHLGERGSCRACDAQVCQEPHLPRNEFVGLTRKEHVYSCGPTLTSNELGV